MQNFNSQVHQAEGFTSRQVAILAACAIVCAGLVWVGVVIIRRPLTANQWVAGLKKPGFFFGALYALSFLVVCLWVLVFGWQETLRWVLPKYDLLYHKYSPLLVWALLLCIQAGLVLWAVWLPRAGIRVESKSTAWKSIRWNALFEIAAFLLAIGLYALLLKIQIGGPISSIFRFDLALLTFPALFLLYFGFRHPGWVGNWIGLWVVLVMASMALACLWNSGFSEEPIIMGLLPYKDASNYYTEAQLLLNGLPIQSWGGRPIFSLFLAVLLRLTGSSLQTSLAIMTATTILCCYFAAREVNRSFGAAPATFTMYLLFIYYRQFIGLTYTENLGLAFGALSLAFTLQGARAHSFWTAVFGLFLVSMAMNVRPGPMLILPCLALWFVFQFRRSKSFRALWIPLLLSSGVILIPFALNILMIKSLAIPGTAIFSRFPHTLYGLAEGGKSWGEIYRDYPAVTHLPQDQQSAAIIRLAFLQMRAHPGLLLKGITKFFIDFFSVKAGAFDFIREALEIRAVLFYLSLFGLGYLLLRRTQPASLLVLAGVVGILLSVPFVPTRDSDRMRIYAAAVPFLVMVPSVSLGWLSLHSKPDADESRNRAGPLHASGLILSGFFIVCVVVGPFGVKSLAQPPANLKSDCPAGETAVYIRINQGSYVQVIADGAAPVSHLPNLRMSDVSHSLSMFAYAEDFAEEPFRPGMLVLNTLDLKRADQVWIAVPAAGLPVDGSLVEVCGRRAKGSIFVFAKALISPGR